MHNTRYSMTVDTIMRPEVIDSAFEGSGVGTGHTLQSSNKVIPIGLLVV